MNSIRSLTPDQIKQLTAFNSFVDLKKEYRSSGDSGSIPTGTIGVFVFAKVQAVPETITFVARGSAATFMDNTGFTFTIRTDLQGAFIPGDFEGVTLSGTFAQVIIIKRDFRRYDAEI